MRSQQFEDPRWFLGSGPGELIRDAKDPVSNGIRKTVYALVGTLYSVYGEMVDAHKSIGRLLRYRNRYRRRPPKWEKSGRRGEEEEEEEGREERERVRVRVRGRRDVERRERERRETRRRIQRIGTSPH